MMNARNGSGRIAAHAPQCSVDGGRHRHGRRGFWCAKCDQLNEDTYTEHLLVRLEKYAGVAR